MARLSFKIAYRNKDFKRVSPFISTEIYRAIQPQNNYGWLDTYRYRIGLSLDLPKRHSVKLFYMYEHENRSEDNLNHIYCVQYNYSIRPLYKDKKKDDDSKP